MSNATEFIQSIRDYVRASLLSYVAESMGGITSDCSHRAGTVLVQWAENERDDFHREYKDGGCTCFISPPCGYCTHPGNPVNQEECDDCWEPALKGGAA